MTFWVLAELFFPFLKGMKRGNSGILHYQDSGGNKELGCGHVCFIKSEILFSFILPKGGSAVLVSV